ncbi:MAG TPA: methyltransferase domain-containing protein [Candidatus Limnocylindria bacterium]|nr:methyltransferase domain-containing protein [Candidatus Limnocylindria bacterium]
MTSSVVLGLLGADLILFLAAILYFDKSPQRRDTIVLSALFFCSGMPALIYQVVWQRVLFAIYGVNAESVAVVVSAFMLGLGLGSLAGGWLSSRFPQRAIVLFGAAELGVALFGLSSLKIFHWAAEHTAGAGLGATIFFSLVLLILPTMLMGATLPLLVEHLVRNSGRVGYSVATLYFVNTFGSAVACYLCASFLLREFGQSGSVTMAALVNTLVGATAFLYGRNEEKRRIESATFSSAATEAEVEPGLKLGMAMLIAGIAGFIALGFEIAWFRVFSLAASDRAPAFALLLSTYLAGIAAGSYLAEKLTDKKSPAIIVRIIGVLMVLAGGISVYLPPLVGELMWRRVSFLASAPAFFVTAGLLGSVLPLLCQLAVTADDRAGRGVSLVYVSNIIGSALGSLLIGFVAMQYFGLQQISHHLGLAAVITGGAVLCFRQGRFQMPPAWAAVVGLAALVAVPVSSHSYSHLFERLIFGNRPEATADFAHLVENRNGVIAVTKDAAVFGGGVYDGYFNVDPLNDSNLVARIYALSALHPAPKRLLMIGLASGSWAQIVAHHPQVESMDVVEINPGYLQLIAQYPVVQSLLKNPKVHIFTDDGRRWLLAHPEARYDAIVANTSYYWRDHSTTLLSVEFLQLVRQHLKPGGIFYYNTTTSDDVLATGLAVFPYGMRVLNFLAVSDSPFAVDVNHWISVLREYTIDGQLVFDPARPRSELVLQAYRALAATLSEPPKFLSMEGTESMRARLGRRFIITDDDMGWEWRSGFQIPWRQ